MQRFCTDLKVRKLTQLQSKHTIKKKKNYLNHDDDDSDLSDLETDDRMSKPIKQTQNSTKDQHPIIIFGNDDAESVNLDNLPPVKFRW